MLLPPTKWSRWIGRMWMVMVAIGIVVAIGYELTH
jgi:hypothetical protein